MPNYIPKEVSLMNTPLQLLIPIKEVKSGVKTKTAFIEGRVFFANFKTYGGTERLSNDKYVIEDTAKVVCWYDTDIKADCRIKNLNDGVEYEIINRPEDINQQHQFLSFKVRAVLGGA